MVGSIRNLNIVNLYYSFAASAKNHNKYGSEVALPDCQWFLFESTCWV